MTIFTSKSNSIITIRTWINTVIFQQPFNNLRMTISTSPTLFEFSPGVNAPFPELLDPADGWLLEELVEAADGWMGLRRIRFS